MELIFGTVAVWFDEDGCDRQVELRPGIDHCEIWIDGKERQLKRAEFSHGMVTLEVTPEEVQAAQ